MYRYNKEQLNQQKYVEFGKGQKLVPHYYPIPKSKENLRITQIIPLI
jgi:hypothetical protein